MTTAQLELTLTNKLRRRIERMETDARETAHELRRLRQDITQAHNRINALECRRATRPQGGSRV